MHNFLKLLRSWVEQDEKAAVKGLALQTFGFYFETVDLSPRSTKNLDLVVRKITQLLGDRKRDLDLVNTALQTVHILLARFPSTILSPGSGSLWDAINECLVLQDPAVRLAAMGLVGSYLADFAKNQSSGGQSLVSSHGMELDMSDVIRLLMGCLEILGLCRGRGAPGRRDISSPSLPRRPSRDQLYQRRRERGGG